MAKMIQLTCQNCGKEFEKRTSLFRENAGQFCKQGCANSYNNKHRAQGIKVSRFERWLKPRLEGLYPDLDIHFNRKDAIESELDIYIPAFKLAFELNGELHYEPIFSEAHLKAIQKNDAEKAIECEKRGIDLVVIDTSALKYITTKRGHRYLRMVSEVIDRYRNNA